MATTNVSITRTNGALNIQSNGTINLSQGNINGAQATQRTQQPGASIGVSSSINSSSAIVGVYDLNAKIYSLNDFQSVLNVVSNNGRRQVTSGVLRDFVTSNQKQRGVDYNVANILFNNFEALSALNGGNAGVLNNTVLRNLAAKDGNGRNITIADFDKLPTQNFNNWEGYTRSNATGVNPASTSPAVNSTTTAASNTNTTTGVNPSNTTSTAATPTTTAANSNTAANNTSATSSITTAMFQQLMQLLQQLLQALSGKV